MPGSALDSNPISPFSSIIIRRPWPKKGIIIDKYSAITVLDLVMSNIKRITINIQVGPIFNITTRINKILLWRYILL
jgi:hypothetical protein